MLQQEQEHWGNERESEEEEEGIYSAGLGEALDEAAAREDGQAEQDLLGDLFDAMLGDATEPGNRPEDGEAFDADAFAAALGPCQQLSASSFLPRPASTRSGSTAWGRSAH